MLNGFSEFWWEHSKKSKTIKDERSSRIFFGLIDKEWVLSSQSLASCPVYALNLVGPFACRFIRLFLR
jgi:hypothetical protein